MVDQVEVKPEETTAEAPAESEVKQNRPEGLPEKFNSVEDLAKSYAELESKLGQPKEEAPKEEAKTESNDLEIAEKAVESSGLDMESLNKEFSEEGKLVDQFIADQQAIAEKTASEVRGIVGGDEQYGMMITWAKDNLSESEIAAYNTAVNNPDIETVKLAVSGLQSRYQASEGKDPSLVKGTASGTGEGGYTSWAQVTKDMADDRYSKDPAFQAEVKQKIANSNL